MRRLWLDVVIGWNQGTAEKHERRAARARAREWRARTEYRARYLRQWYTDGRA